MPASTAHSKTLYELSAGDHFTIQGKVPGENRLYKALSKDKYIDIDLNIEVTKDNLLHDLKLAPGIKILTKQEYHIERVNLGQRKRERVQSIIDFETSMKTSTVPTFDEIYQLGMKLHKDPATRNALELIPGVNEPNTLPKYGLSGDPTYSDVELDEKIKQVQKHIEDVTNDTNKKPTELDPVSTKKAELRQLHWEKEIYKASKGRAALSYTNASSLAGTDGKLDLKNADLINQITNPQVQKQLRNYMDGLGRGTINATDMYNAEGKVVGKHLNINDKYNGVNIKHKIFTSAEDFNDLVMTARSKFDIRAHGDHESKIFNLHVNRNRPYMGPKQGRISNDMTRAWDLLGEIVGTDKDVLHKGWDMKWGSSFRELGIDPTTMNRFKNSLSEGFANKNVAGLSVQNLFNTLNTYKDSAYNILSDTVARSEYKFYEEAHLGARDTIDSAKLVDQFELLHKSINHLDKIDPKKAMSVRSAVADSYIASYIKSANIASDPNVKTLADKNNFANQMQKVMDGNTARYNKVKQRIEHRMDIRASRMKDTGIVDDITMNAHMGKSVLNLTKSAALGAGIMYFVDKMRKSSQDKESEMEGLSHNSLMTVVNRRKLTDFGSSRGLLNIVSKKWAGYVMESAGFIAKRIMPHTIRNINRAYKSADGIVDTAKSLLKEAPDSVGAFAKDLKLGARNGNLPQMFRRINPQRVGTNIGGKVETIAKSVVDIIKTPNKMEEVRKTAYRAATPFMEFTKGKKGLSDMPQFAKWGLGVGIGGGLAIKMLTPNYEPGADYYDRTDNTRIDGTVSSQSRHLSTRLHDARYARKPGLQVGGFNEDIRHGITDFGSRTKPVITDDGNFRPTMETAYQEMAGTRMPGIVEYTKDLPQIPKEDVLDEMPSIRDIKEPDYTDGMRRETIVNATKDSMEIAKDSQRQLEQVSEEVGRQTIDETVQRAAHDNTPRWIEGQEMLGDLEPASKPTDYSGYTYRKTHYTGTDIPKTYKGNGVALSDPMIGDASSEMIKDPYIQTPRTRTSSYEYSPGLGRSKAPRFDNSLIEESKQGIILGENTTAFYQTGYDKLGQDLEGAIPKGRGGVHVLPEVEYEPTQLLHADDAIVKTKYSFQQSPDRVIDSANNTESMEASSNGRYGESVGRFVTPKRFDMNKLKQTAVINSGRISSFGTGNGLRRYNVNDVNTMHNSL